LARVVGAAWFSAAIALQLVLSTPAQQRPRPSAVTSSVDSHRGTIVKTDAPISLLVIRISGDVAETKASAFMLCTPSLERLYP